MWFPDLCHLRRRVGHRVVLVDSKTLPRRKPLWGDGFWRFSHVMVTNLLIKELEKYKMHILDRLKPHTQNKWPWHTIISPVWESAPDLLSIQFSRQYHYPIDIHICIDLLFIRIPSDRICLHIPSSLLLELRICFPLTMISGLLSGSPRSISLSHPFYGPLCCFVCICHECGGLSFGF